MREAADPAPNVTIFSAVGAPVYRPFCRESDVLRPYGAELCAFGKPRRMHDFKILA